ncbi:MAG: VIT1/CCC1 transporter family protein [Elusimicrobia bacterium]|nr:VIT1/CCC1 transporter family protein [Elusimicrobiota bacterium]
MNPKLARRLVLDELFDLTLYQELYKSQSGSTRRVLEELIPVETKHFHFWQDFFKVRHEKLDWQRRLKLGLILLICRFFGEVGVHIVLEAIEVYGVRKYLSIWETYKETPLGEAVRGVLQDEFGHEDTLISEMTARKINPERIRSIFLGFNDGLVETLGAVSGFFAAFDNTRTILIAALTAAIAGSISMAAGAYVAEDSEAEIQRLEREKAQFLNQGNEKYQEQKSWILGVLVGVSHFTGAMIPILPVVFGAKNLTLSLWAAGVMTILISTLLSFLSGMNARKRVLANLTVIAIAAGISYIIGFLAKAVWGIGI